MKWEVPYINLPLQFANQEKEITNEFKRVMREGSSILRDDVRELENNIDSYIGVKHAIGVNSGTDALYLSVAAPDIAPGDEVITVAHTFVARAASIVHRGAKPVFVDIANDFNMDADQVEKGIFKKR